MNETGLCEYSLIIKADLGSKLDDNTSFLNFFNNLTNTFSCIPGIRGYIFEDVLSQQSCDQAIALLRHTFAERIKQRDNELAKKAKEARRNKVEEQNLVTLIKKVFKKDAVAEVDPEGEDISITIFGTQDSKTIVQALRPFVDNRISSFTTIPSFATGATTITFPTELLSSLKQGLELNAVVFVEHYTHWLEMPINSC